LRDCSNAVVGVLTSSLDITDRKRAENHLFYMAHHDVLTSLANRALLSDRLRREIARTRRGDSPFALHLIDLDGFKDINDGLGHQVGDQFLVEVANRLRSVVRDIDTVARLGGDEFAVLQTRVSRNEDAVDMANRILEAVNKPWSHAGEQVTLSASIGITVHPTDGTDVQELLRNSDLAMYRAKHDGGKVFRFYASDMDRRARESDPRYRSAHRDRQEPVRPALPAANRAADRARYRRGGALALAAPGARPHRAERIPGACGGKRPHHSDQ
jgi:diguanylate cyclase (GGDEF)-like protein